MGDLVRWFRAVLDEGERVAREACHGGNGRWRQIDEESGRVEDDLGAVVTYDEGAPTGWEAEHIAKHDPAYVLADIAAKRRLLDAMEEPTTAANVAEEEGLIRAVRIIASAYSHRDGYQEAWRP